MVGWIAMCEVLVRVADKISDDPYMDAKLLKAGDVVVIQRDGGPWGTEDLTSPAWRIIKFTAISVSTASAFLGPEIDTDPANPNRMLRRRAFALDLTNAMLPADFRAWLNDVSRAAPTRTVALTVAQLLALKKSKTPLADPNVI